MVVRFVAYIDESGDTGLQGVKPNAPQGASEWLVLSCFLVRERDDINCPSWTKEILAKTWSKRADLHFSKMLPEKKQLACELIAAKPCRYFIVASNKKNIEGYENVRAAIRNPQKGKTSWLYWWLARLLLERVTEYCEMRIKPIDRGKSKLKIIFSRRGALTYRDFDYYLKKLHWQSVFKTQFIDTGDLCWSMIDFEEVFCLDHSQRAGLQLADMGAGAFFNALERNRPADCVTTYAKLLKPRMALDRRGHVLGFGIKPMPALHSMGLAMEQREIFEFYGYSPRGW
ncbi:MAG: DUF3800 domain-containing protein [Rhizomicrobium sp.]